MKSVFIYFLSFLIFSPGAWSHESMPLDGRVGECAGLFPGPMTSLDGYARFKMAFPALDIPRETFNSIFLRTGLNSQDPHYVPNMVEVSLAFGKWFNEPETDIDSAPDNPMGRTSWRTMNTFTRMLSSLHRIAILGKDGKSLYWPDTAEGLRQSGKLTAGLYRIWSMPGRSSEPLVHKVSLAQETINRLGVYLPYLEKRIEKSAGIPQSLFYPNLIDVHADQAPRFKVSGNSVTFFYPPADAVKIYLEAMAEQMAQLIRSVKGKAEPLSTLKHLARYYQLGIIGHPFSRVNNSLLMAQVNVVLLMLNLNPIAHGDLDYLMRSLNSQQAEEVFLQAVSRVNPQLSRY